MNEHTHRPGGPGHGPGHGPGRPPMPMNLPSREEALGKLFAVWTPARQSEVLPLDQCVGRTLAETQYSAFTLPISHVAACDGVAVKSAAFADGMPDTSRWKKGAEFVMADTGDDFPDEYDAVVRIEDVGFSEDGAPVFKREQPVEAGEGVRPRGSTIHEGDLLMEANRVIRPTDLSALAMGGACAVPVWKKPVVAFLPTGSELIPWESTPRRGENIDSNSLMVVAMLKEMGAEALAYPIVKDQPEQIRAEILDALGKADVVVINGGSSKGGEDFSTRTIREMGQVVQYQVAAVPGRPMALGLVDGKPVINLPGPPLAAYFGADWCLRAIVEKWLNHPRAQRHVVTGRLKTPLGPGGPVEILHRIQVTRGEDGGYELEPLNMFANSSASIMASNAQYVMPRFAPRMEAGETLEVTLLRDGAFME